MGATKELTPLNLKAIGTDGESDRARDLRESSATLARLPERLEFPPRLRQRITFDPRRRRLSYYGFMMQGDYDLLRGLNGDASYQQALEQLFRESSSHSVVVDIGVDQVLDDNDSAHPVRSVIGRWVLPWGVMIACVAGGGALVWWLLQSLR